MPAGSGGKGGWHNILIRILQDFENCTASYFHGEES